jgi:uncharacterized membrane protein
LRGTDHADVTRQPTRSQIAHYLRAWVALGLLAFVSLVIIFYWVVMKPA